MKNYKLILGIVIGLILASTIVVFAAMFSAYDVGFTPSNKNWTVNNVADALDDLFNNSSDFYGTYGVKRKLDASTTAWERLELSKNLVANAQVGTTAVKNDFDNIYPWSDIKSYNYNTDTGEITAWYGDSEFSFNPSGNTEVLTYIPEFYYLRYQMNGYEYVYISPEERENFTKSNAFSIGRYVMSGNTSRVHSKSKATPLTNINITNFRSYAKKLGTGFGQLDWRYFIIQLLYLVEYADYDAQKTVGLGNTSNTSAVSTGGCDELGMKSGSIINDGKHSMIYRGVEDAYGNVFQFLDGVNAYNYQVYINYNPTTYAVNTFSGDYKKVAFINAATGAGSIKRLGYDTENPLISTPVEIFSDYNNASIDGYYGGSDSRIMHIGQEYSAGRYAGFWYYNLSDGPNWAYNGTGARLIKYN